MVILIDLGKVFNKIKHPASTNLTQERRTLTQIRPYVYSITKCLRVFFFPSEIKNTRILISITAFNKGPKTHFLKANTQFGRKNIFKKVLNITIYQRKNIETIVISQLILV